MDFTRGQRLKLEALGLSDGVFSVTVDLNAGPLTVDVACFGLDGARKLSDERYMTFFNQPATPCGAVKFAGQGKFDLDLARLPASIDALVMTLAIDGAGTMRQLGASSVSLKNGSSVAGCYRFDGGHFASERAVMLLEFYRKDGAWRLCAVGQGFNGGLDALVTHFGGEVEQKPSPLSSAPPPPATPKVSLSKITLTKAGEKHTLSLEKGNAAPKKIVVKAVWTDNNDGLDNDDLDLRAGVLLADGRIAMVTAPDRPGSFNAFPYIRHLGDVTGASASEPGVEVIEVNPSISQIMNGKVAIVFSVYSAVSNGAVSIQSLSPRMIMEYGQQIVECRFDFKKASRFGSDANIYTYVIGLIEIDGDRVTLSPSGLTSEPDSEATPWLKWRAKEAIVTMDGPYVFKGEFDNQIDTTGTGRRYL